MGKMSGIKHLARRFGSIISAACYSRPQRPVKLGSAWTFRHEAVTCPRCKPHLRLGWSAELARMEAGYPAGALLEPEVYAEKIGYPVSLARALFQEALQQGYVEPVYRVGNDEWTPELTRYNGIDAKSIEVAFVRCDELQTAHAPALVLERIAIINGEDAHVRVAAGATVADVVAKACEQTGNTGRPPSEWIAYSPEGARVDPNQDVALSPYRMILSLKVAAGGCDGDLGRVDAATEKP